MVGVCLICKKNSFGYPQLSFHRFPADITRRNEWLKLLDYKGKLPKRPEICSEHFKSTDFYYCRNQRFLKKDAIPSTVPEIFKETNDARNSLSSIKLEPSVNDGDYNESFSNLHDIHIEGSECAPIMDNSHILSLTDFKTDALKTEIQITIVKEELEGFFDNENNKTLLEGTKIKIEEQLPLKMECENFTIEEKIKREILEQLQKDEDEFKELDVTDSMKFIKTETDEFLNLNGFQDKELNYKLETQSNLDQPDESDYVSYLQNSKTMDDVSYRIDSCDLSDDKNQDENLERTRFDTQFGNNKEKDTHSNIDYLIEQTNGLPFACQICNETFLTKQYLDHHIVSRHEENNKESLDSVPSVSGNIKKCRSCEYKTDSSTKFHEYQEHESTEKKQKCRRNTCIGKTINKSYLRSHVKKRTSSSRFVCQICNRTFSKKMTLEGHIVSMHSENKKLMDNLTSKIRKCSICEYQTVFTSSLKIHVRTHESPEKRHVYQCDICNFKTIFKSNLNTHIKKHTNERRFPCQICNKSFWSKLCLDGHIVSRHSDNKTMMDSITSKINKCYWCDYKTVLISGFKIYVQRHKIVKTAETYQCDVCGYKTVIKRDLKKHCQVHASKHCFMINR